MFKNRFWPNRSTATDRSSGSTSQPTRQPVIEKYFEKLLTTTAEGEPAAVASFMP